MNRYGRQAMQYWQSDLPGRYAQIPDPQEHFRMLGEQVADQIATLSADMASGQPPEEGYLAEIGRLNRIKQQAEEAILAELVFLPSENDATPAAP